MAERLTIVEKDRINYEGIFDAKEVFNVIKDWTLDKGYIFVEKSHSESTKAEGKYIDMNMEHFKKFTDYAKSILKMRMQFNEVKDVVVEHDGKKTKQQEGKISIVFDGILETDYESKWESKPIYYILRVLFEKYLYTPFISGFERTIAGDVNSLKNNLKSFLNMTKYR